MTTKRQQLQREFVKTLERLAATRDIVSVFGDVVGVIACSLEGVFTNRKKEVEDQYQAFLSRFTKEEARQTLPSLLANITEALEDRRESYLGPILEEIGAANTHNGQFLTPSSIANLMGRIGAEGAKNDHRPGELVRLSDPACGAGVLLISGAEEVLRTGIPQRDIFIVAGDVDRRACDMTFIELSLLGYAARIEHRDALAMKELSRPRWTVGYYINGTQWREFRTRPQSEVFEPNKESYKPDGPDFVLPDGELPPQKPSEPVEPVQMTMDFFN